MFVPSLPLAVNLYNVQPLKLAKARISALVHGGGSHELESLLEFGGKVAVGFYQGREKLGLYTCRKMWYNVGARGRNSASCRVIVGLRPNDPISPASLLKPLKLAAFFVSNRLHTWPDVCHLGRAPA